MSTWDDTPIGEVTLGAFMEALAQLLEAGRPAGPTASEVAPPRGDWLEAWRREEEQVNRAAFSTDYKRIERATLTIEVALDTGDVLPHERHQIRVLDDQGGVMDRLETSDRGLARTLLRICRSEGKRPNPPPPGDSTWTDGAPYDTRF